jgi:flagellar assembly factor FliW
MSTLEIQTTRFGTLAIEPQAVVSFPEGISGLDGASRWVLLADADNDALGWLQSTTRPQIALAVVSPRRFVADYQVRVARSELARLGLEPSSKVHVLAIVSTLERSITCNLKAPLIIDLERRLGRQVVTSGDYSMQFELCREETPRKKIA